MRLDLDRESLVVYQGVTTSAGNVGGTTLIDAALIGKNDFISSGKTILLLSGASMWEDRQASVFNNVNGTITVSAAFSAQIPAGVSYLILAFSLASIVAAVAAIKTQTDKLAGAAPVSNSVIANWQSGVGTSGEAGADLVTLGANDVKNKVNSLHVKIAALTVGATITVKMFQQINGVETKCYNETFVVGTDPNDLWIINSVVEIHEALRVEVQSNNVLDNGLAVVYDYVLEAM